MSGVHLITPIKTDLIETKRGTEELYLTILRCNFQ